jgi:hypothetical protein
MRPPERSKPSQTSSFLPVVERDTRRLQGEVRRLERSSGWNRMLRKRLNRLNGPERSTMKKIQE